MYPVEEYTTNAYDPVDIFCLICECRYCNKDEEKKARYCSINAFDEEVFNLFCPKQQKRKEILHHKYCTNYIEEETSRVDRMIDTIYKLDSFDNNNEKGGA